MIPLQKEIQKKIDEASKKARPFEPKYGGKDHSGYDTLMKYEVNDYIEYSFIAGANLLMPVILKLIEQRDGWVNAWIESDYKDFKSLIKKENQEILKLLEVK